MPMPAPIAALWTDLEAVRGRVLAEVQDLSQAQADWQPAPGEWSIGEVLHHLALAETGFGKLTSKLLRDAGDGAAPWPADLAALTPLPPPPPGPGKAPEQALPTGGQPIAKLVDELRAVRERTRQTIERLGGVDPRPLRFAHPAFGSMDLGQWWQLQVRHDGDHLQQIRAVKAAAGFPPRRAGAA
jgi:hypothetical protein